MITHPQVLGQCADYMRSMYVKAESDYDEAGSVKKTQGFRRVNNWSNRVPQSDGNILNANLICENLTSRQRF
jgi:hypothetical protein